MRPIQITSQLQKRMKRSISIITISLLTTAFVLAQVPEKTAIFILRAEDSRKVDAGLLKLLENNREAVRERAALALGRIGDEMAVGPLVLLLGDESQRVSEMAAFALGEIESAKASKAILKALRNADLEEGLRAALVEAAGKIAAANPKIETSKELGREVIETLRAEKRKGLKRSRDVVLFGLTAALRARPEGADKVIAGYFTDPEARIRADAANAYARVKGKSAGEALRSMLTLDEDPVARANAARALGAASDRSALKLLFEAAEADDDLRVRVSAMRSVGSLAEASDADRVRKRVETIFAAYKASKDAHPDEQNEMFEAVSALGRIAAGAADKQTLGLLREISKATGYEAPEVESSIAKVDPRGYWNYLNRRVRENDPSWKAMNTAFGALSAIAEELKKPANAELRTAIVDHFRRAIPANLEPSDENRFVLLAVPSLVQLFADLEPEDVDTILRTYLTSSDVFVRAAAASAIGDRPANKENAEALAKAFGNAIFYDKDYDDAQLAILSALVKLDKERAKPPLALGLKHYDYLVRRQALRLIEENGLEADFPDAKKLADGVRPYDPKNDSKLGQVLNSEVDYRRALSRKNGEFFAAVSTTRGTFEIEFYPEDAPLTVDNFIKLAGKGYFDGIDIHRVVPNFVVQDGDPRGDGNGGPGWSIRCEINRLRYERGMVGMALSGKDTGGSQWFVTHSPQPHLDGGYTIFGKVSEEGMKVVDRLQRGDRIERIRIVARR